VTTEGPEGLVEACHLPLRPPWLLMEKGGLYIGICRLFVLAYVSMYF